SLHRCSSTFLSFGLLYLSSLSLPFFLSIPPSSLCLSLSLLSLSLPLSVSIPPSLSSSLLPPLSLSLSLLSLFLSTPLSLSLHPTLKHKHKHEDALPAI